MIESLDRIEAILIKLFPFLFPDDEAFVEADVLSILLKS